MEKGLVDGVNDEETHDSEKEIWLRYNTHKQWSPQIEFQTRRWRIIDAKLFSPNFLPTITIIFVDYGQRRSSTSLAEILLSDRDEVYRNTGYKAEGIVKQYVHDLNEAV